VSDEGVPNRWSETEPAQDNKIAEQSAHQEAFEG